MPIITIRKREDGVLVGLVCIVNYLEKERGTNDVLVALKHYRSTIKRMSQLAPVKNYIGLTCFIQDF